MGWRYLHTFCWGNILENVHFENQKGDGRRTLDDFLGDSL